MKRSLHFAATFFFGFDFHFCCRADKREVKEVMRRFRSRAVWMMVFWLAFIFVTSCFVIPFSTFVHFVQALNKDAAFKQWFAQFWLLSWFFVVKGWHALEYAILVFLGTAALHSLTKWRIQKSSGIAFAFVVLFAASDEYHQTFVRGRDGCLRDAIIDSTGALVGAMILLLRGARAKRNGKSDDGPPLV